MTGEIPDDLNGDVLRRMVASGDDLATPRMIDFCFVFPDRASALTFAGILDFDQPDDQVSLSRYQDGWQAIVHRLMAADHAEITRLEGAWGQAAEECRGKADGWGCMTPRPAP